MAYGIVHFFPGGTKEQYEASIAAVHPSRETLPKGQIFHAAGPSAGGWTIVAVHESKESWEEFRDRILVPKLREGVRGGFTTPPEETAFDVDNLQRLQAGEGRAQYTAPEAEIREASRRFYAALNGMANGDASAMTDVWSHGVEVTATHPIGGREVGWNAVTDSFDRFAHVASNGSIRMSEQLIQVYGDMAYEVGSEQGQVMIGGQAVKIDHRVTNIYRREGGEWKMVHHHTDVSPAMLDVLSGLRQTPASAEK